MDLEEFFETLNNTQPEDIERFTKKYVFHGTPFVFRNREHEWFDFRDRISKKFNIDYSDVFIVGSGKLGFSYFKKTAFSLDSDIDVVLHNSKLFDDFFHMICDFETAKLNGEIILSDSEEKEYSKFKSYFVRGWMRPDLLPNKYQSKVIKNDWFEFFKSISYGKSEVGNYKIAAGLFKDSYCLEKYYIGTILEIQELKGDKNDHTT
jgi:hypothetical protein